MKRLLPSALLIVLVIYPGQVRASGPIDEARAAVAAVRKRMQADPAQVENRRELAAALQGLAKACWPGGDPAEAERAAREAVEVRRQLASDAPGDPARLREWCRAQWGLGELLTSLVKLPDAELICRAAVDRCRRLPQDGLDGFANRRERAKALVGLALVCQASYKFRQADAACREAIDELEKLIAGGSAPQEDRTTLTIVLLYQADALAALGRRREGEARAAPLRGGRLRPARGGAA